jgi:hypothetical protein
MQRRGSRQTDGDAHDRPFDFKTSTSLAALLALSLALLGTMAGAEAESSIREIRFWGVAFDFMHRKNFGCAATFAEAKAAFGAEYQVWKGGPG